MRAWRVACLCLALAGCLPQPYDSPLVVANGERLVGRWDGGTQQVPVASFKGVPFADPPLGELRWRAPRPHIPRSGDQPAREFAPACMQGEHIPRWYADVARDLGADPDGVGRFDGVSEDCLYLNVWTPKPGADAALPVMVWVHGGSNKGGWSYEPNYLGDRLAARGVVVVSVAYRLGPFGFFAHPALDNGPGEAAANFGWLDIMAALGWVRAHIGAFGGDPGQVTVLGESSGAGNIADLLAAEWGGPLPFRRLAVQSYAGSLDQHRSLEQQQAVGQAMTQWLGMDAAGLDAKRLRGIPAEELVRATDEVLAGEDFDAVIDGRVLARQPLDWFQSGAAGAVDLLIGSNADEWLMYVDDEADAAALADWLRQRAPPGTAARLRAALGDDSEPRHALDRLYTARQMRCPAYFMAGRVAAAGGQAWVYHFSRVRPGEAAAGMGAYHGTEIAYVFDQHEYWQPVDSVDRDLTRQVSDYWLRFARSGDPNGSGATAWPAYREQAPKVLELGDSIRAVDPPDAALCRWLGLEAGP